MGESKLSCFINCIAVAVLAEHKHCQLLNVLHVDRILSQFDGLSVKLIIVSVTAETLVQAVQADFFPMPSTLEFVKT